MRLRPLKRILAVSVGFLGCFQLVSAAPALVEVEVSLNSTHYPVAARDSGSEKGGGYFNQCREFPGVSTTATRPIEYFELSGWCGSPLSWSSLKLNGCYANIDGDLFPVNDGKGNFHKTCKDCRTSRYGPGGPSAMTCTCERKAGDIEGKETTVDLNLHIWVVDKILGCPGVEGKAREDIDMQ